MKSILTLMLAVLSLTLQPLSAQKTEGTDNFKYHKAVEILDEGGDPAEARKLAVENIKENPRHIDSYLLITGVDRREGDFASAMRIQAMKNNHKKSGFTEAVLQLWKGIIYEEMGEIRKAAETLEVVVKMARKEKSDHLSTMLENLAQFRYDLKEYDASDALYREMIKMDETALLPKIGLLEGDPRRFIQHRIAKDRERADKSGCTSVYIIPPGPIRRTILGGNGVSTSTVVYNELPIYRYTLVCEHAAKSFEVI